MTNSIVHMTERFERLPVDAQKAIQEFEYDTALKHIHTAYKLHIDQASQLEKIVADIVFGDRRSQEMVTVIEHELRVPNDVAVQIAVDVNGTILVPIQKNMQRIQLEGSTGV